MRVVIQRTKEAHVAVDDQIVGQIENGLLILVGIEPEDKEEDIQWLVRKISNMRIFSDENGLMNLSVKEVNGGLLVISQFTLHASTKKGNRPSFIRAARPDYAIPMYEKFMDLLAVETGILVESGEFGADMKVHLINDGPVTIVMDSKSKE